MRVTAASRGQAPHGNASVRVCSDTGWCKRVLRSLNVQVSTRIPYDYTSNPLCERQIRVLKENVRIWCKTERTKDWMRLLPIISLIMNSQESSATKYLPHDLFMGRLAWFLHAPYPEDSYKVDKAKAMLQRGREPKCNQLSGKYGRTSGQSSGVGRHDVVVEKFQYTKICPGVHL